MHGGPSVVLHRFSRTELLLGTEALERLAGSRVAVFGIGGVGSFAAEALARVGIGHLVLVDYDDVCLTNTNRQIHALKGTVGKPKVDVMAERIRLINPEAEVEALKEFYSADNRDHLLAGPLDYVIDAIDHVSAKVDLIASAYERGLPLVSCMGAGDKLDPTRFVVADIAKTHTCPLAKAVRAQLRQRGIVKGIKVVFSTETPRKQKLSDAGCKTGCICPNRGKEDVWRCYHRRHIPGTVPWVPAAEGLVAASVVVRDLLHDLLAEECPVSAENGE